MSLFLDIGTGAGLAGATGVRPFLPPLLAGALARGDMGIDFDGTDWSFLESPVFLAAVVGLAVASYAVDRSDSRTTEGGRSPVSLALRRGRRRFWAPSCSRARWRTGGTTR